MLKIMVAARRRAGMSREEHLRYFERVHGAKVLGANGTVLKNLSKYTQNHVFDAIYNGNLGSEFDSVGELWFADGGALQAVMSDPYTLECIRPDESNFSDSTTLLVSMVAEEGVAVREPRNSNTKLMQFIYRPADIDSGTFVQRWRDSSALLAQDPQLSDKVRHFVRNHPLPAPPGAPSAPGNACDGINSVWIDRGDPLGTSQAYHRSLAAAEVAVGPFMDRTRSFLLFATEIPIHPVAA
jgi:EthD domain